MGKSGQLYIDMVESGEFDDLMDISYQKYLADINNQQEQDERTRSKKPSAEGQNGEHQGVSEGA